jgi:N-acetylated-alpha-linked acidic dipeptidase
VERKRRREGGFEVELAALGSGADFVAFQDHLGLPTLQMEFDFEGSYGAYHSNYDTRSYVERFSDPGFIVGRTLVELLGLAAMRFACAPVLPFRYSHYGRKIGEYLDAASTWPVDDDGRPVVKLDLANAITPEKRIDAALASDALTTDSARALNDRLARLEQSLLDESEPADKRWYRHVIYGWNIYSLYEGQPLPGLAEAIRVRSQKQVDREVARIEAALMWLVSALDQISITAASATNQQPPTTNQKDSYGSAGSE